MLTNGIVVDQSRLPESALEAHPVSVAEEQLVQSLQIPEGRLQRRPVRLSQASHQGEAHVQGPWPLHCVSAHMRLALLS